MSGKTDVLVLGAGLAGIAAARAALAEGAKSVCLVSEGDGATAVSVGALQFPEAHDTALELSDFGLLPRASYRLATLEGTLLDAHTTAPELLDLGALGEGVLAVADLAVGARWQPAFVARSLEEEWARPCARLSLDAGVLESASLLHAARALDGRGAVEALGVSLRGALSADGRRFAGVLLPPILGLQSDSVRAALTAVLDLPVGECAATHAPTGLRWSRRLQRGLEGKVERFHGTATLASTTDGSPEVLVGAHRLRPRAVVAATGGLAGGGLSFEGRLRERFADAPVWFDEGDESTLARPALSASRGMDPAPLFGEGHASRAGVRVDAQRRALGPDGHRPLHPWLFVAGSLLAGGRGPWGHSHAQALSSGTRAGRCAAASLR